MDTARPLVLMEDTELLDEALRLAAAAGCDVQRVPDPSAARQQWASAPLVLLDDTGLRHCAEADLPRRADIVVLTATEPDPALWRQAVELGVHKVLALPEAEDWLTATLADIAEGPGSDAGRVLAVIGGRGGAGASVLSCATSVVALRRGEQVLLVDCDPLGGGLDLMLGAEHAEGLRWPGLTPTRGRMSPSSLRSALPTADVRGGGLTVLSCDRDGSGPEPAAVEAVVSAGRRGGGIVVCDLPRHLPAAALTALDLADLAVLVVPAEVRACAAASRVAERALSRGVQLRVVVRGPAPGGLLPTDVERSLALPLLTSMRPEPGIDRALDNGHAPAQGKGPLAEAAGHVLDVLCGSRQ
ncbi:septum site-determining protein Ssd [Allokutzneria albata]|uniref:Helicase/secretion neighborhood CpaE-like protein n=1 Tax=Allokutzneria albata TaxID=211114 RepID=A0A1H0AJ33_ALLAB|nr:septum site-determining protein Ssd [Allokutzneria albata]SDN33375.1 helicase/secretion neighborhood CpaE-like protein [Allokutzneria albata]